VHIVDPAASAIVACSAQGVNSARSTRSRSTPALPSGGRVTDHRVTDGQGLGHGWVTDEHGATEITATAIAATVPRGVQGLVRAGSPAHGDASDGAGERGSLAVTAAASMLISEQLAAAGGAAGGHMSGASLAQRGSGQHTSARGSSQAHSSQRAMSGASGAQPQLQSPARASLGVTRGYAAAALPPAARAVGAVGEIQPASAADGTSSGADRSASLAAMGAGDAPEPPPGPAGHVEAVAQFLSGFADVTDPQLRGAWEAEPARSLLEDCAPESFAEVRC
jgi:hypothetical protein